MIVLLRLLLVTACVLFGMNNGFYFLIGQTNDALMYGAIAGAGLGIFVVLLDLYFKRVTVRNILAIFLGVILGLLLSHLIATVLAYTPLDSATISKLAAFSAIILSYVGAVTVYRGQEEFSMIIPYVKFDSKTPGEKGIILDTSVVIDGRIADICETAFLSGKLIVPRFVLKELQLISDSADDLKRNRGRRGLDVLNRIKQNPNVQVVINEMDFPGDPTVDAKLVKMGQALNARVFTNDYNLNKVAELQGVQVLNINDLANALKPIVMPGELLEVRILKEGKESDQGVAYLDDGTMVVVDGGRRQIGQTLAVSITSVLQTSAGRMIFAKLNISDR